MKWDVIFQPANLALYGQGVVTTLYLLFASLAIGAVLALAFALALTSRWRVLRAMVGAYTYVVRGTPLLIQVYLIYYGLGQLEWIQARWDEVCRSSRWQRPRQQPPVWVPCRPARPPPHVTAGKHSG